MSDPTVLLEENGFPWFLITVTDPNTAHGLQFEVHEVVSWMCDGRNTPADTEVYVSGFIKWDGCSNLIFGDGGYVHLCGRDYWNRHARMMAALYDYACSTITNYDPEVGG